MHTLRKKMHVRSCMHAYATVQKLLRHANIANLSWVSVCEHRAGCRLLPALLPARRNQLSDAVRLRNLLKSTLAHDAVAAAVSKNKATHSRLCCPWIIDRQLGVYTLAWTTSHLMPCQWELQKKFYFGADELGWPGFSEPARGLE